LDQTVNFIGDYPYCWQDCTKNSIFDFYCKPYTPPHHLITIKPPADLRQSPRTLSWRGGMYHLSNDNRPKMRWLYCPALNGKEAVILPGIKISHLSCCTWNPLIDKPYPSMAFFVLISTNQDIDWLLFCQPLWNWGQPGSWLGWAGTLSCAWPSQSTPYSL